jgi:lysophospholipase L1-like esterase
LTYNAPYFARQLSEDEYGAYQFAYSQGKSWLQKAGYHSAVIGPELTDEDFADRVHLTSSGGQKMAQAMASEIQSMSVQLGYRSAGSNPSSK